MDYLGVQGSDRTFNFTTRNWKEDNIIDEKWLLFPGLLEETNNTNAYNGFSVAFKTPEIFEFKVTYLT